MQPFSRVRNKGILVNGFVLGTLLLVLSACAGDPEGPSLLQPPRMDAPFYPTPEPVVDQQEFMALFETLCLISPSRLSHFDRAAAGLGLKRKGDRTQQSYIWEKPIVGKMSAVKIAVGRSELVYTVTGSGSGLPTEERACSVTAFLPKAELDQQQEIMRATEGAFRKKAKGLDFQVYAENYVVKPRDIAVKLKPARVGSFRDMRPGAACPTGDPCWKLTPATLSVTVVLERIP